MNQRLIAEIGKSQRLQIVNRLKRTRGGLSVGELAEALQMSYMGVKQHCLDLEKRGYLDVVRRPKPSGSTGRPELVYRLTAKAQELFPKENNTTTLEVLRAAQTLYGPAAPEKLLFLTFQQKAEDYTRRVTGETFEQRVRSYVALRDEEGYMAELVRDEGGTRIVEYHTLIFSLMEAYPALLHRLEQEMVSTVLKVAVRREIPDPCAPYSCVFHLEVP